MATSHSFQHQHQQYQHQQYQHQQHQLQYQDPYQNQSQSQYQHQYQHQRQGSHPHPQQPLYYAPQSAMSAPPTLYQQNLTPQACPPQHDYNHYNTYQSGPVSEVTYQRQQYQQHLDTVQQEQQMRQLNGPRSSSTLPTLNSLKDWFDAIDTDHSGSLTCEELQQALVNGDGWTPFNMETVRMMVNMFDRDGNGTISFNEFKGLWAYIERWKTCFRTFDLDGSGTIDASELRKALRGFGYNLSEGMISLIITKYDVRGRGDISFDNFVQSCVTIQTLTDAFRRIDVAGTGIVTMTYEQFLGLAISHR